jgi:hypothetical protein
VRSAYLFSCGLFVEVFSICTSVLAMHSPLEHVDRVGPSHR